MTPKKKPARARGTPLRDELILVEGVAGFAVYLNEYRIAGIKPWGGGEAVSTWRINREDVLHALNSRVTAAPSRPRRRK